jgi:hypothetical protein
MNELTRKCQLCKKPMLNSWHTFTSDGELMLFVHMHCEQRVGCKNCINMILRGTEGQCGECGRIVQLNIDGEAYRILEMEEKNVEESNKN